MKLGQRQGDDVVVTSGSRRRTSASCSPGRCWFAPAARSALMRTLPAAPCEGADNQAEQAKEASHESLRSLHSPSGDDGRADGFRHSVRRAGVLHGCR